MTAIALSTTTPLLLPSPRLEYKFWCWICFWCSGMLVTSPWVYLTWWICRITITLPKGKCRYDQWSCVGTSRWQKEFLPLRNSSEGGFFFKPQLVIIVMIIIFGLFLEDIMIIITFKPWLVIILILNLRKLNLMIVKLKSFLGLYSKFCIFHYLASSPTVPPPP